jgi:uncharacterized protein
MVAVASKGLGVAIRCLRLFLIGYLLILLAMMLLEEKLIFFPTKYPGGQWNPPDLAFEDATFTADDGTQLHGWFVPHQNPRAVVLIAHGNGGNLTHRHDLLRLLHELGTATLIFDYRGYGRSQGSPTESGVLQDAEAARRWLSKRTGLRHNMMVFFGESLGGAVAIHLAATGGARGLILENTFSSMADVAAFHYPWLPVRLLMHSRFDSVAKIRSYHGPLLQIHGDRDTIVPVEFGRRLFDSANEPKRLLITSGGDHNDPRTGAVERAIGEFLDSLPAVAD